jgi:hypothetical protein
MADSLIAEGGKPILENRDKLEWTAAAFDYYAEIGLGDNVYTGDLGNAIRCMRRAARWHRLDQRSVD